MAATIKLSEAERRKPGFIEGRPVGAWWILEETPDGDWNASSKFGSVGSVVFAIRMVIRSLSGRNIGKHQT